MLTNLTLLDGESYVIFYRFFRSKNSQRKGADSGKNCGKTGWQLGHTQPATATEVLRLPSINTGGFWLSGHHESTEEDLENGRNASGAECEP